MSQENWTAVDTYLYQGNISKELLSEMLESYRAYKGEKEVYMSRVRDNERYYRKCYETLTPKIEDSLSPNTSFIISAIENACADASESYPEPNILEREESGEKAAEALSKIIPIELTRAGFKRIFKANSRNKVKYGTAIYGVFYDELRDDIVIKDLDISDVYVDMHIPDIQNSRFLFISAAVDNELLRHEYPAYKDLFCGDAAVESLSSESFTLLDRSIVLDCYYKKPDGSVHMAKICNNTIISATEDIAGYEKGIYSHGKFPVVFDTMYPDGRSPFGFGVIDIGKSTQIAIDKIDRAITENIICTSKPRYLSKRGGGVNEDEFCDMSKSVVHYEGDESSVKPVEVKYLDAAAITHRDKKIDELKELLANRDFQQGGTSGGVTAASAIEALQQSGEKRSRSMIDDTYDAYHDIVKMLVELIRQFYTNPRVFRTKDENGRKSFIEFSNEIMYKSSEASDRIPVEFDIEIVPQCENPYTREMNNSTMLTLWKSNVFSPENIKESLILLKSMSFDGKENLIKSLQEILESTEQEANTEQPKTVAPAPMNQMPEMLMAPAGQEATIPAENSMGLMEMPASEEMIIV